MSVRLSASEGGGEVGSDVGSEGAKCVLSTACGVLWCLVVSYGVSCLVNTFILY